MHNKATVALFEIIDYLKGRLSKSDLTKLKKAIEEEIRNRQK